MKKLIYLSLLLLLIISFKQTSAQTSTTVKGRIIGQAMEELEGVSIVNMCNAETAITNKRGFYQIRAAKGDTLFFSCNKYSRDSRPIKRLTDNVNVIMINRKTAALPDNFTTGEYKTAAREDDKLYDILEKGAERNGVWNY